MTFRVVELTRRAKSGFIRCASCGLSIEGGDRYRELVAVQSEAFEGDFVRSLCHVECVAHDPVWSVTRRERQSSVRTAAALHGLSSSEAEVMAHALGCDRVEAAPGWRNYYNTDPEDPVWKALVDRGLATVRLAPHTAGGAYFHVTNAGRIALGLPAVPAASAAPTPRFHPGVPA